MNYGDFELEDFLEDSYFQKWVDEPTTEANRFWQEFLQNHPEKSEVIATAKEILFSMAAEMESNFPDDQQIGHIWGRIQNGVAIPEKKMKPLWPRLSGIAAAAAVIILTVGWLLRPEHKKIDITYNKLTTSSEIPLVERKNNTAKAINITLPDSSHIVLEPNSAISYPGNFNEKEQREVYLSGQAFFEVKRNTKRPFFVYANELVTKVLGTSFTIKAFENSQQMEVAVKTGKVSVFTRSQNMELYDQSQETILTPNHRVLYSRKAESMKKYLIDAPEIITCAAITPAIVNFEDAPVSDIFKNLEESYGIDIVYDKDILKNCLLTASFSQESLYDKIELICKGVEAEFAIVNAQIVISGKGCE
ncbi:FecR family protein [Dyadobacter sp. CY312]|uniref:FecR family protein n=1 Tax=Dyadobacter sp. CY312 TaxID=2907303 RepID=UPI001F3E2E0F|nr:FecR domain-containing protein [Dyadobacter sp. CY312]MCE7042594.1 FecR domain-containing protein [Dyadobacter sp. CY312]